MARPLAPTAMQKCLVGHDTSDGMTALPGLGAGDQLLPSHICDQPPQQIGLIRGGMRLTSRQREGLLCPRGCPRFLPFGVIHPEAEACASLL